MITALRKGLVDGLRVVVAGARSLDDVPHDVYLADLAPAAAAAADGGFDEVPYLECLEPVLELAGGAPSWVVDVSRTHRGDRGGVGQAHLSVLIAVGAPPAAGGSVPDLTPVMRSAFSRMVAQFAPAPPVALARPDALDAAVAAVGHAYPDVDPGRLSLTDEEHHADQGQWSFGLSAPGATRFRVLLGLVPGLPGSAHVHRMPLGEVVDSVGP
ncbi:hypothetical protein [Terrabacter sp. MAHUQ-38]|uniref:hypothetical protein n=1 Tax=unclassified Terrabacter TaxID=2630222 RepID=UPI00165DD275|nr:hypothetical protein [Terrabacter sp. MAHUQ-38]MBC9824141.1 hypothetical protein [Terrabacter sp. MAHUQ-38]